jgi:hypothetical protein
VDARRLLLAMSQVTLDSPSERDSSTPRHTAIIAIGTTVGLLLLVALIVRATPDVDSSGDGAAISLATLEALHSRVLLGPYSQFGWHHPGPLLFYVLAPLYFLTGHHEMSIRWTALLLNIGCFTAILANIRRFGRPSLVVPVAALMAVLILRPGGDFAFSAWNPHITVLPLGLLVCLAAACATNTISLLPWCALVASFIVQSDVALGPAVATIVLATTLVSWLRYRTRVEEPAKVRAKIRTTVWLLAALWFLPLAEEVVHNPSGNVDHVLRFFRSEHTGSHSTREAWAFFSHYYLGPLASTFANVVGHRAPTVLPSWEPVAAAVVLVLGGAVAWRLRRRELFRACLLAFCIVDGLAAVWSAYRIPGGYFDYQLFWASVLGALTLALIVPLTSVSSRLRVDVPARIHEALGVLIVLITLTVSITRLVSWQKTAAEDQTLFELYSDLHAYAEAANISRPVLNHTADTWADVVGLVLQFAKRGFAIASSDELIKIVGQRYQRHPEDRHVFVVYDVHQPRPKDLVVGARLVTTRGNLAIAEMTASQ